MSLLDLAEPFPGSYFLVQRPIAMTTLWQHLEVSPTAWIAIVKADGILDGMLWHRK